MKNIPIKEINHWVSLISYLDNKNREVAVIAENLHIDIRNVLYRKNFQGVSELVLDINEVFDRWHTLVAQMIFQFLDIIGARGGGKSYAWCDDELNLYITIGNSFPGDRKDFTLRVVHGEVIYVIDSHSIVDYIDDLALSISCQIVEDWLIAFR